MKDTDFISTTYSNNIERFARRTIDVHCHGIGRFDFTEIADIKLQEIETLLASRHRKVILTLYLPKPNFNDFLMLMEVFSIGKQAGKYKHIEGIALEGPLLASHGGTPAQGVWNPSKHHWKQLAECGRKGLVYVIFSPDAHLDAHGDTGPNAPANNVAWIAETLLNGGVLPAAGHFTKENPIVAAQSLQSIYDVVAAWGYGVTLTDHLFNDMPHNFKHAWRTRAEKERRDEEIKALNLNSWTMANLEEKLGPVPATMIRNAYKGIVKITQNFDGEHVDLAIVKKTVELLGAENMLMMTDSIESKRLAGHDLHMHEGSTLLYQEEDIVAAGSQGIYAHVENMFAIGLSPHEITLITDTNPTNIIHQLNRPHSETSNSDMDKSPLTNTEPQGEYIHEELKANNL